MEKLELLNKILRLTLLPLENYSRYWSKVLKSTDLLYLAVMVSRTWFR